MCTAMSQVLFKLVFKAEMNNYYHHQNPPVRQQRRDPRYYGHPEEVELSIIRKSNAANYIKIYCLSTELDEFLIKEISH